jgi:hypothetical protein
MSAERIFFNRNNIFGGSQTYVDYTVLIYPALLFLPLTSEY